MTDFDHIVNDKRFLPYHGWHDDHRGNDRTPQYLPAIQQVRDEFVGFIDLVRQRGLCGRCLQIGLGTPGGSHLVLQHVFADVVSIEQGPETVAQYRSRFGDMPRILIGDSYNWMTWEAAKHCGPYDVLFIDGDHTYEGVHLDHANYSTMVKPGGIIAFHDALERPGYEEEISVWRYLATLDGVQMIGRELGIAWVVNP